jgi:uncharacterized protein YfbU (UPF0304 family)
MGDKATTYSYGGHTFFDAVIKLQRYVKILKNRDKRRAKKLIALQKIVEKCDALYMRELENYYAVSKSTMEDLGKAIKEYKELKNGI